MTDMKYTPMTKEALNAGILKTIELIKQKL